MAEPDRRPLPSDVPRPTSGRENNRAFIYAVCGAAVVLAIVLAFNFAGPPGPAKQVDLTNQTPRAASAPAVAPATPPAALGTETITPQRGDTPTPPGRASVGAPVGGNAPAAAQPPSAGASAPSATGGDAAEAPASAAQ